MVIVKDMDMPKYCPDCWFSYDDPGDHKLKCKAKPCENRIISQAEPSDCPLQEVKTGHWIIIDEKSAVCSCCYRNNTLYGDFCKWCGAKMRETQKVSDKNEIYSSDRY